MQFSVDETGGCMGCVIAFLASSLALNQHGGDAHKREFAYGIVSGDRVQGYRIKRRSACGGCLGDHRR